MLVPGEYLGDTANTCYVPVFMSSESRTDTTWHFGNLYIGQYYFVLDASPSLSGSMDPYNTVSFAPKNPSPDFLQAQYNCTSPSFNPQKK